MSALVNNDERKSRKEEANTAAKPKKRVKLSVARTVLPKGHSLNFFGPNTMPGARSSETIDSVTPSPLLSKIQNFLPKMKEANDALSESLLREDPKKFDVEYISDDEKGHVEMNIALVSEDTCNNAGPR